MCVCVSGRDGDHGPGGGAGRRAGGARRAGRGGQHRAGAVRGAGGRPRLRAGARRLLRRRAPAARRAAPQPARVSTPSECARLSGPRHCIYSHTFIFAYL